MLYDRDIRCHGNMCYVILMNIYFAMYILLVDSMCVPTIQVNRCKRDDLKNMPNSLTPRDATTKNTFRMRILIANANILQPTKNVYNIQLKGYGSNSGFHVVGDIDLEILYSAISAQYLKSQ